MILKNRTVGIGIPGYELPTCFDWLLTRQVLGNCSFQHSRESAPENLSLLKKIVLNLLRMDTTDAVKFSLRLKRKRAAWDDDLRTHFLGLTPL